MTVQTRGLDEAEDAAFEAELKGREAEIRRSCQWSKKLDERERLLHRAQMVSDALGEDVLTGEPRYSAADVLGWMQRCVEHGAMLPNLGPATLIDLLRLRRVPNAIFRERFEELQEAGEMSADQLAVYLGFERSPNRPGRRVPPGDRAPRERREDSTRERPFWGGEDTQADGTRVLRLLGLKARPDSNGLVSLRVFIPYEDGVKLAEALGMSFTEAGV